MECESLARAEALAAARALGADASIVSTDQGVLVMETGVDPSELAARLGLCHFVGEWLGSCSQTDLEEFAAHVEVPGPIRIRSTKVGDIRLDLAGTSRKLGRIVGDRKGVDLHKPKSEIRVVFTEGKVHVGRTVGAVDRTSFERRKNRYMPFVYPASLHPKYARAMVNLTRVPRGGSLLDPFCGTGAIVAEAAIVGLKAIGTDFSDRMIEGTRKNLDHLGLKASLRICDVGSVKREVGKVDGIATDPPYGRSTSTKGESIPDLYKRAFATFHDVLDPGGKVVTAVTDPSLVGSVDGFNLLEKHPLWVHRSMTRNFCVLENV